eukprot:TRINITY_DN657_c0_g1_i1.p1 TRINITY_DN657_c0_g1~~TRINITY_DN657_c0_g1_i1.p1  ORF type:complete len:233 (-),score=72.73 TRINITY_DN657_c0_g1_i1:140-838(-)
MSNNNNIQSHHKIFNPLPLTPNLYKYVMDSCLNEPEILKKLRIESLNQPKIRMMSDPVQIQFMCDMLKMINAKKGIEVGVFLGYGTLAFALSLPDDGKVIGLDISEEFTSFGKKYWKEANVEDKIDLRIKPASESFEELVNDENELGTFDFVFIDADKCGYKNYYEESLKLLRPNGVIFIDNVLWRGEVLKEENQEDDKVAICELNEFIKSDDRVSSTILTIGDGVTVVRKI